MKTEKDEHQMLQELLTENQKLLSENNELLKKLNKRAMWSLWIRIAWFLVIIGAPLVLYYYVLQPYFDSFGSSFDTFRSGLQEVPGWKQFWESISEAEVSE